MGKVRNYLHTVCPTCLSHVFRAFLQGCRAFFSFLLTKAEDSSCHYFLVGAHKKGKENRPFVEEIAVISASCEFLRKLR